MSLPDEPDLAVAKIRRRRTGERLEARLGAVYVTGRRRIKRAQNVQQRALAGAGFAHNGQHLSLPYLEGQIFKDHQLGMSRAEGFLQTFNPHDLRLLIHWMQAAALKYRFRAELRNAKF